MKEPLTRYLKKKMLGLDFENSKKIKKILTIDKFSTAERGFSKGGGPEREYVFFPTSLNRLPESKDWSRRSYDLCYTGSLFPQIEHLLYPLIQSGLKICVVSHSKSALVTHSEVSYEKKLELVADSKFALVHNQLFLTESQAKRVLSSVRLRSHGAFSHLCRNEDVSLSNSFTEFRVPQLKSRLFEAAMVGTIPLVIEDTWNIAEDWFIRGEHFYPVEEANLLEYVYKVQNSDENQPKSEALRLFTQSAYSTEAFVKRYIR